MNRQKIINLIPKPSNTDVIIYDTTLKDFIDMNVFEEYKYNYLIYSSKIEEYKSLEQEVKQYETSINNAYLYNSSYKEEDYLQLLQNDKKTYSTLYSNIKKLEDKINVLRQKIQVIDEQIETQKIKDNKDLEKRKKTLDEDIEKKQEKLLYLKEKTLDLKNDLDYVNKNIEEIVTNKTEISKILETLDTNTYICPYCNSKIENKKNKNKIEKDLNNKTNSINKMLLKYEKQKKELEYKINDLIRQQKEITVSLNNDNQFKKQDFNFYQKKSVEVLKLEALKNKTIKNISELEKTLKSQPGVNSNNFIQLKDRISKYELSLDNLKRIKALKIKFQDKISSYTKFKSEINDLTNKLTKELKFISIYYKICEQKINNYIGENITFKLFKINEYKLEEILEIYYNGIFYENLNNESKLFVDKIIAKNIYKNL